MSLKYCFQNEIHKTFNLPPDYPSLIQEIRSLFVQKLPSQFIIQYQDADGDRIVISTNQEYLMMVSHELPNLSSSIKIFVTSLDSLPEISKINTSTPRSSSSNGSFEVVEDDNSLKVEEVVDDLSLDDESKNNSTSKVVVSLTIPNEAASKDIDVLPKQIDSDQEGKSFLCSENEESKGELSGELAAETSSSAESEKTMGEKEESRTSNAFFNQAFQTEEDDFSFSNESFKKEVNSDNEFEDKRTATLRVPQYIEKDSKDLSEYFNRITQRKSSNQSFEKSTVKNQKSVSYASEGIKHKEESQEKWVSFSTEQDDALVGQPTQSIELQGRNLFNPKQKAEAWFVCHQEPSYRYQEDGQEDEEKEENLSDFKPVKDIFKVRDFEDFVLDVQAMGKMLIELKDDSFYQEHKSKTTPDDRQNNFEEERLQEDNKAVMSRDVWYDAYQCHWDKPASSPLESNSQLSKASDSQMNFSNELSYNLDDYLRKSDKDNEKNKQENVENMNISLLSMSEAKYMASAIGSIHKIRGFKQKLTRGSPTKKEPVVKNRIVSPSYNRWISRNYEIKLKEEKINPFGQENEPWRGNCSWLAEKKDEPKIYVCTKGFEDSIKKRASSTFFERSNLHSPQYRSKLKFDDSDMTPLEVLVSNMCSDSSQKDDKSDREDKIQDDKSLPDESNFKDFYNLGISVGKSMTLDTFHDMEEAPIEYKFEYKELHNTPLSIRPGSQEWCVVFKTISLKNTGNVMWTKCQLSPIGLESGNKSEVSYVAPGDSVYVTLEIFGFFRPGRYNSSWKVTHRGEMESVIDLGYIDLEFEIFEKKSFIDESNIYRMMQDRDYGNESSELNLH